MKKHWYLFMILHCALGAGAMAQGKATNQRDAQHRKQGYWVETVGEIRGEPGYTQEGVYKNDRKEGVWKKTSPIGTLLSEETYKHNVLDGLCKYYFPNGKLSEEGSWLATEIPGEKDTIMVIDPVTNVETPTVIIRLGNAVRNGVWKVFDEETGKMVKEYYKRGDQVTAEEIGDSTTTAAPAPPEPQMHLPHENAGKQKKRGQ